MTWEDQDPSPAPREGPTFSSSLGWLRSFCLSGKIPCQKHGSQPQLLKTRFIDITAKSYIV